MRKTAYQLWQEEQGKIARGKYVTPRINKGDSTRKSSKESSTSYSWEKENLSKVKGKNYDKKYETAMSSIGVTDEAEKNNFRRWLDQQENRSPVRKHYEDNGEGTRRVNNLVQSISKSSDQRIKDRMNYVEKPEVLSMLDKAKLKIPFNPNRNYEEEVNRIKEKDKQKANDPSLLKDVLTPLKQYGKGVGYTLNPNDGKDFRDAFKELVDINKTEGTSSATKELNRGVTRVANKSTLDLLNQVYKSTRRPDEDKTAQAFTKREGGGKAADFAYDTLGYGISALGIGKFLRGTKLGAKANTIPQLAKEGSLIGLGMSGAEVGLKEGLNPKDQDWKDNLTQVGLETAGGAILDPAIFKFAQGIGKGVSKHQANKAMNRVNPADLTPFTGKPSQEAMNQMQPKKMSDLIPNLNKPKQDEFAETLSKFKKSNEVAATAQKPQYENVSPMPIKEDPGLVRADQKPKDVIQSRINEIKELKKSTKDLKVKEQYNQELDTLNTEHKKAKERDLLEADATFDDLIANSDEWKDKGKIFLKRETMDRNFDDIMGADAPLVKKLVLDPVKAKEAERTRFLNEQRNKVRSYGIKPGSKDDELVQMYGEKKIDLNELQKRTPNWANVKATSDSYRANYDKVLDQVNKVLVENDFDPIPKRKDYFPHFEEVDGILKQFGFDMQNHVLPTDINGLTANFKPTKSFFQNALQRKGDLTDFGAAVGFDRYVEGISNVIYHTKNIKRLRALDKSIRNKYEGDTQLSNFAAELSEYTNILAGKKAMIDRAAEDLVGRRAFNLMDTVRRRVSANMIGANLASAMTGYIPLTQAAATTKPTALVKGMFETMTDVFKRDGLVQESDFLTKRIGSDPLYRTLWDKTVDKSMWFMRTVDNFSAQAIVRGKYYEGIEKGIPHEQALKQADDWASKILGDRSKGSMPTLMSSKTLGVFTQFQLEVNNQLSFFFKDMPRSMNKTALASGYAQLLLYSFAFNSAYEQLVGRRPAFDPIGLVMEGVKDYNNDNISNTQATGKSIENVLNTLPFSSALYGGRFPMQAGVPNPKDVFEGRSTWTKEGLKPLTFLVPPAGGSQTKKVYESLTNFGKNPMSPQEIPGQYQTQKDGDKVLRYPVKDNPANFTKSLLFGKYSLPESSEFFDNERRNLSVNQTKEIEKAKEPMKAYNDLMKSRRTGTLEKKITDLKKDKALTEKEKKEKMENLLEQLRKVKEVK